MDKEQQERKKRIDQAKAREKMWMEEQQRLERKHFWIRWGVTLLATLIMAAIIFLLAGCGVPKEQQKATEAVDGMIYSFIVAKVEGNDDLLDQLLTKQAKGILEAGRHPYPGAAEKMGQRYEIIRYDGLYKDGGLVYEVLFYRPSTATLSKYNVLVINTPAGWRITSNSSVDEMIMEEMIANEKGTVVHAYESGDAK